MRVVKGGQVIEHRKETKGRKETEAEGWTLWAQTQGHSRGKLRARRSNRVGFKSRHIGMDAGGVLCGPGLIDARRRSWSKE